MNWSSFLLECALPTGWPNKTRNKKKRKQAIILCEQFSERITWTSDSLESISTDLARASDFIDPHALKPFFLMCGLKQLSTENLKSSRMIAQKIQFIFFRVAAPVRSQVNQTFLVFHFIHTFKKFDFLSRNQAKTTETAKKKKTRKMKGLKNIVFRLNLSFLPISICLFFI